MACLSRNLGLGQHFQNAFRKMLVDLGVSRNRLRNLRGGVVIPVVLSAVANQQAANSFELPDEVFLFTGASVQRVCGPLELLR